jgi:hypothetical protein
MERDAGPEGVLGGITTLICATPATRPGASPANATEAACPLTVADTFATGTGIEFAAAQPLKQVTLPVRPAGEVCPSPVMNIWTALPAGAGFEMLFTLLSELSAAAWPAPVPVAVKMPEVEAIGDKLGDNRPGISKLNTWPEYFMSIGIRLPGTIPGVIA